MEATMSFFQRVIPAALVAVSMIPATAAAQSTDAIGVGIKAGINSSTLSLKDSDIPKVSPIWGANAGLFVVKNISPNLGWQAEALFSQRGAQEDSTPSIGTIRTTFVDVPVTVRFGSTTSNDVHFHAFTGPQFGIKLNAELTDEPLDTSRSLDDEIKSWDLGWTVGAGVEKGRASFDLRYTHGLTNLATFSEDGVLKNRTFSFLLGYRLK